MKNNLTPKNPKMCDPILVTLLKMRPHSSQSSRENATPSSATSPLAIHTYIRTCFLFEVLQCISTICKYLKLQTTKIPNHMWLKSY